MAASSSTINTEPTEAGLSPPSSLRLATTSSTDCLSDQRKFHDEGGAAAGGAVHADFAGVLLDDAIGDGKTQPGAAAVAGCRLAFGGEERIVDTMDVLLGNAAAGVRNPHLHVMTVVGADGQRAAARHGVLGVQEQVQEHLLQLAGVAVDCR